MSKIVLFFSRFFGEGGGSSIANVTLETARAEVIRQIVGIIKDACQHFSPHLTKLNDILQQMYQDKARCDREQRSGDSLWECFRYHVRLSDLPNAVQGYLLQQVPTQTTEAH